jgi:hypothetical protein
VSLLEPSPARSYLLAGLGAQLILAVALGMTGGMTALAPAVIGSLGLLMRWTAIPIITLLMLAYFLAFPDGQPVWNVRSDIPRSFCRTNDLLLVFVAAVYYVCYFRLLAVNDRTTPPEHESPRHSDTASSQERTIPHEHKIDTIQIATVLFIATIIAQISYFIINHLLIDMRAFPPVHWINGSLPRQRMSWSPEFHDTLHRTLAFILGATTLIGIVWFGLWYWCLQRLSRVEARMLIRDSSWRECRRELNRQAKWRAWVQHRMPHPRFATEMRQYLQWILWIVLLSMMLVLVVAGISYIMFIME